ncbi:MAG: hypothetical protein RL701_657 [Pseudomonadota bacterium]
MAQLGTRDCSFFSFGLTAALTRMIRAAKRARSRVSVLLN